MNMFFPTTVVDDVLHNPDEVRDYALSLDYYASPEGRYPGGRSKDLKEINPNFQNKIIDLCMSQYWEYGPDLPPFKLHVVAQSYFQLINGSGEGIIHPDTTLAASIIYLSPNIDSSYGTSIYKMKVPYLETEKENRNKYNSQFEEQISIKNTYNRMIMYDGHLYHKGDAPSVQNNLNEQRLTLITFFYKIEGKVFPVPRMKRKMLYY